MHWQRRAKQREELDLERYESGHEEDAAEAADAAAAEVSEPEPGPRQAAAIGPTTVQQFFGSGSHHHRLYGTHPVAQQQVSQLAGTMLLSLWPQCPAQGSRHGQGQPAW